MKITPELLQAIISYLITQPYQEVSPIITEIQKQVSAQKDEQTEKMAA